MQSYVFLRTESEYPLRKFESRVYMNSLKMELHKQIVNK